MLKPLLCFLAGLLVLLPSCNQNTSGIAAECGPDLPEAYTIQHPAWVSNASIYEVNIRQYTPEGTFKAFEAHLPRLQQMGVGVLWLMPVQPIGELKRKGTLGSQYSIREYRAVNPEFGTMADLRHLIEAAHQRGMHVILDWVANHTAWDSQLAKENPDWFTKTKQGNFQPPVADWQDVIDLDYSKPELRRYMLESMTFWLREANFDGFRCDVAGLVPTDFWNDARRQLQQVKPVFMLAEWDELYPPAFLPKTAFDPNTKLLEKAFDATYGLRLHYLLDSIAKGQKNTTHLDKYLAAERRRYPAQVYLMNFTSSHDVNSWDGTEYERLGKNALPFAVLTTLLPGVPIVYSGQEAALKKRLRFFDKDTIPWNDYPLQDFYTRLLQLKKTHPALRNGDPCSEFERLPASLNLKTYAFVRRKGAAEILVALNLDNKPHELMMRDLEPGNFRELFTEQSIRLGATSKMLLTPHSYRVYERLPEQKRSWF